ncbi:outer membrane beta-barrel protein [Paraflavitalea speifideaquila]|uniref:outer membrane beta-barrel protein n=1 Tax=Paraflavitalea speifideaquila TaxID=3076558 RepID=UPI0028EBA552|nr:outer membrane beta-barrel protein [Paraflavitalea speifideiaquila]
MEAGSNGDKYWNNSGMLNAFKAKRKFSAFGIMSTTGKTGLDWNERMNYGGNSGMESGMSDDGGMYIMMGGGGDDFDNGGSYWGEGLPKGWAAGIHYSNKWNQDKLHLNGSYKFNKINTEANGRNTSKYILPDTLYYVNEFGNNYTSKERHRVDGMYEIQLDSSSSLKITAGGSSGKTNSYNISNTEWLDEDGKPVRTIDQRTSSIGENKAFNSTLLYRKKFKKQGRTISVNFNQDYKENESQGFLLAKNEYFDSNGNKTEQLVDQKKLNDNITSLVSGKVSYTEPLTKRALLEFNYGLSNNHRQSRRTALGKLDPSSPKYDDVVDSLSNDYAFNVLNQSAGINYRYAKPKRISFGFGANIARADFTRKDLKTTKDVKYSFTNFFPSANITWTLGSNGSLRFNYNGSTQAPNIDQIQPVADNSDQSNIRRGNPDLKQAFRQRFNISYNNYKILSERGIYMSMSFSTVQNDFSSMTSIKDGTRITTPVNVNGNYNINGWFDYNKKVKLIDAQVGPNVEFSKSRNINFIDGKENTNNNYSIAFGINLWKQRKRNTSLASARN